ncbi:hypothetical protein ACFQ3Z_24600 [Streptomyces nogalater]
MPRPRGSDALSPNEAAERTTRRRPEPRKSYNGDLSDSPELVNDDPYGDGWMIRLRTDGPANTDGLLGADEYAEYPEAESD